MSEEEAWRLLHMAALFFFLWGLGATLTPLFRFWRSPDLRAQVHAFQEAGRNQAGLLLPGLIVVGVSGLLWGLRSDHVDPIGTGWLLTVEIAYLVALFVCLPGMVAGLRRARLLALQAQKTGEISADLRATLDDRGPLVFGTLLAVLVVFMTVLAVLQPY